MNGTVHIMHGPSGSGKTTATNRIKLGKSTLGTEHDVLNVFSADHYFIDAEGNYKWDASKIGEAHFECFRKFICFLEFGQRHKDGGKIVEGAMQLNFACIVDNPNLEYWEWELYEKVAQRYNWEVIHCYPDNKWITDPESLAEKNQHSVPLESCIKMVSKFSKTFEKYGKDWVAV